MRCFSFLIVVILVLSPMVSFADVETLVEADALLESINQLRVKGKYSEAAVLANNRVVLISNDSELQPWRTGDAEILAQSIMVMAALANHLKMQLASADSLQLVLDEIANLRHCERGVEVATMQYEIREKILGSEHPDLVLSLSEISYFQHCLGNYEEMFVVLERKERLNLAIYGELNPRVAMDLSDAGCMLTEFGELQDAEVKLIQSLMLLQKLYPGELFWREEFVYPTMNNLAVNYSKKGEYSKAISIFREILTEEIRFNGPEDLYVLVRMGALGTVLSMVGELGEAEKLQRQSSEEIRRCFDANNLERGIILSNLATTLHERGKSDEGLECMKEALSIFQHNYPNGHYDIAICYLYLGKMAHMKGDDVGALVHSKTALSIFETELGPKHFWVAWTNDKIGLILLSAGQYQESVEHLDKAVLAYKRIFATGHRDLVNSLIARAQLYTWNDQIPEAEADLVEASEIFEKVRVRVGRGIKRAAFMNSPYTNLAFLYLHGNQDAKAWQATEKSLGRVVSEQLNIISQDEEHDLAVMRSDSILAMGQSYSLQQIQAVLDPQTAIIGTLDGTDLKYNHKFKAKILNRIWAYVIREQGPVIWISLAEGDQVEAFVDKVEDFKNKVDAVPDPFDTGQEVAHESRLLYREMIQPLLASLVGVDNMIVIPSGRILGLPLSTLQDDQGKWLGELYNVSYCPSSTVYAWLQGQETETDLSYPEAPVFFLADPPFNENQAARMEHEAEKKLLPSDPDSSGLNIKSQMRSATINGLPRLYGSRREVLYAKEFFQEEQTKTLLGKDASEQNLRAMVEEMSDFRILHLATHAFINNEKPGRCALILSQVDLPTPLESLEKQENIIDGRWTATEILTEWKLDADLVVLSGCGTALGKQVNGEGQVGFAQSILQAGARNIILSYWEVDDVATSILFERFYYYLTKDDSSATDHSIARALRQAQYDLRETTTLSGGKPYRHPWYWAGFVLIGGG